MLLQVLSAGLHSFSLRFLNLYNPHNIEEVSVRAQIVSSYVELVIDPESSSFGGTVVEEMSKHVAFLPPVTVPPPPDSSQHASNFWFTLRNIFDEDLSVKLSAQTSDPLDRYGAHCAAGFCYFTLSLSLWLMFIFVERWSSC